MCVPFWCEFDGMVCACCVAPLDKEARRECFQSVHCRKDFWRWRCRCCSCNSFESWRTKDVASHLRESQQRQHADYDSSAGRLELPSSIHLSTFGASI